MGKSDFFRMVENAERRKQQSVAAELNIEDAEFVSALNVKQQPLTAKAVRHQNIFDYLDY